MGSEPSSAQAVFLVVFGAGASNDSVPPEEQRGEADWKPPLASDLFANRPNFRSILGQEGIREATQIAHEMRRLGESETVEQRLGSLIDRSETYEPLKRQLRAAQLYLQQLLWDCGQKWVQGANYVTNYSELVGRLDRWRVEQSQEVVFVTFNYDTLLEGALPDQPTTVSSYVEGPLRIYKVHGSVNWGLQAQATSRFGSSGDLRTAIVRWADDWRPTGKYQVVRHVRGVDREGYPLLPVIAIPTVTKSSFVMPPEQLDLLRADLKRVRGMLVIGWKGNEAHFLRELQEDLPSHVPVDVVSPNEPGSTGARLADLGKEVRTRLLKASFTEYMNAPAHLDALLAQSLNADRGASHW